MSRVLYTCVFALVLLAWSVAEVSPADGTPVTKLPADSIFTNGKIYVGKQANPWVSAVAIRDGKFVYVGTDASSYLGPETRVHDLKGKLVVPGLIDGHTHIGIVGLSSRLVELREATDRDDLMDAINELVAAHPDRDVILGGYWPNGFFDENGPHHSDLDAIESERPLVLYDTTTHSVWANTPALKAAGVTRDTPDIVPGFSFYKKDDVGEPTGWITESAASVFINHFQDVTPSIVDRMRAYLDYFRSMGVTTVLDAGNFGLDHEVHAAIAQLDREGRLPVRYHGSYTLFKPQDLPGAVQKLKSLAEEFNSENVSIDTMKVFYDGVVDTRTAAMMEDYLDMPGYSGDVLLSREQMHQLILALDAEGFNLHVHSVGDRAAHTVLNAVEDAHKSLARPPGIRITICHLEFVLDSDFERFRELGVIANFTPHWAVGGGLDWYETGIGQLAYEMQRAQALISDGARVTFSSDNTTESEWMFERNASSPFLGMQIGHTRRDMSPENAPRLPPASERLQLGDLLNGYTTDAAYQLGRNDNGTIAVGKRADLVVLNQNFFTVEDHEIHRTKPVAVVMDGKVVEGQLPAAR